jgi:hypothetical protein
LIIAEMLGDQTPEQAIEGSPFPIVSLTLDQTIFIHTPEYLPFEPGKRYAWMVQAVSTGDPFPFINQGRSEIMVFDFMESVEGGEDINLLAEIVLEPGFARHNQL